MALDVQGILRVNLLNRTWCVEWLSNKIRWCGKFFSTFPLLQGYVDTPLGP